MVTQRFQMGRIVRGRIQALTIYRICFVGLFLFLLLSFIPAAEEIQVFTTDDFKMAEQVTIKGKKLVFKVSEKCEEGMPRDCISLLVFEGNKYKSLLVHGTAYRFAAVDLNGDKTEELMVLSQENGNWREVHAFGLTAPGKGKREWRQCLDVFFWYPGFEGEEGCPAKIYRLKNGQYKIMTTDAASTTFACTSEKIVNWK